MSQCFLIAQSAMKKKEHDPTRTEEGRQNFPSGLRVGGYYNETDPLRFGASDLDPLRAGGMSGGGMLFDPLRSGLPRQGGRRYPPEFGSGIGGPMIPRGSVPPGARFDPMGPPDADPFYGGFNPGRFGPNPDHMPPPGFGDMFM